MIVEILNWNNIDQVLEHIESFVEEEEKSMVDEIIGMLEENRDLEQAEIEKYRNRMNSLSIKEASKYLS